MTESGGRPAHFFDAFHVFLGELLLAVMQAVHEDSSEVEKMPAGLAGLWIAAGRVIGLHKLSSLVQENEKLRELLIHYAEHPLDTLSRVPLSEASKLELGTVLRSFSQGLQLGAKGHEIQRQYTYLLENLEGDYLRLQSEQSQEVISTDELGEEVEELFIKSFYTLTRLQRH